jgi:ribosomal protein L7Ae-like RNA K-turn-binding protein
VAKTIYMLVTNDKYELPLVVADSVAELAKLTGQKRSSVASAITHAKKKGFKSMYVKVDVD